MSEVFKKAALGLTVAVLFFVGVEGVLFVAGVTPVNERTDPYVGFSAYSPLFVESTTAEGEAVFRTADGKIDWFNRQRFPARKAPGVRRVFCVGGSTTYGRPYDDTTSFCGWLRAFLPAADPGTAWEIVNAGGISYASYRIARLMEELVAYEPDLFIVYTGHNEFLERRTYDRLLKTPEFVRTLGSFASGLRTYSVLSDVFYPSRDVLAAEIDNILDRSVGPADYHRDDALRDAVLEHFRVSLERMAELGRSAGAEMVFVTPASNVRDFSPFKAESGADLDDAAVREVEGLKATAESRLVGGDFDGAAVPLEQALSLDPRNADLQFLNGRARLGLGSPEEARRAFVAARDEDVAPLRALSPVARIVAEVAAGSSSGLVDFVAMTREAAPDGIPGDEQFLDHVHPSIEAHRRLALALVDELVEAPSWNDGMVAQVSERVESGIDPVLHARALANVGRVLSWAGKQDEALRLVERATGIARDPHTLYQMLTVLVRNERHQEALLYAEEAARLMPGVAEVRKVNGIILSENGRSADAMRELQEAARLDPSMPDTHYHLGVVLTDLGRTDRAEAAYRTVLQLDPELPDALNNLGILLARRGDVAAAFDLFERAVAVAPDHPDAAANLQRARQILGR